MKNAFPIRFPGTLAASLLLTSLATSAQAEWPEFRGPTQDGHAPEGADLPLEWSEDRNVVWKTEIHDKGWSTPVVHGDQVWLTSATEDGKHQYGICVDRNTGEVLYDEELFFNATPNPLGNDRNTYASPSPVIEEGRVYLHFGSYGTVCLNTETFEKVWERRDLPANHWRGPASSPVMHGDLLILTFDGADYQYLAALDKKTGETVWKQDRHTNFNDLEPDGKPKMDGDLRKAFNTPIFVPMGGKIQMVSPGAKAVWSYEPETGEELWSVHWEQHSSASRTVYSEALNLMFVNTGYGKSQLWAIRMDPEASGEIGETHVEWTNTSRMPNRCSPVLVGERLFLVSDQGVATCLNAKTGEELWQERMSDHPFSASLFYGNGHVYFFDEFGKCYVVEPADDYKVVAENVLDTGMFASPSADGDSLFIRTTTHLYRLQNQ